MNSAHTGVMYSDILLLTIAPLPPPPCCSGHLLNKHTGYWAQLPESGGDPSVCVMAFHTLKDAFLFAMEAQVSGQRWSPFLWPNPVPFLLPITLVLYPLSAIPFPLSPIPYPPSPVRYPLSTPPHLPTSYSPCQVELCRTVSWPAPLLQLSQCRPTYMATA